MGSIEEVHEVIEADDDEGDENTHPSPAQSSDPMASVRTAYNIRNCSPSANAEEPSLESIPSPENAQEDISYPEFPTNMKDAQEWLLDVQSHMPEHIKDMFLCSCVHLTDEESAELGEVLIMYADLFAKNDNDLGCFTEMEHFIDTGDTPPIKQRMRRTPLRFCDEEEYLKKMLDSKVIQPSNSEWASPSVLIWKKDGSVCWTIDFHVINAVTRKDSFPLPLIKECLDALECVQYMSTLDMNSGYFQFAMALADRCKTAFLTKYGLFEFTQMAMGLCNAPATFQ